MEIRKIQQCEFCGKNINPATAKEVELSNTDGRYYREGDLPQGHISQGFFTVGSDCFKKVKPIKGYTA